MASRRSRGKKSASSKDDHTTRGTAPSAPDIESLEKFEASEEAKAHDPSDVDAMGQDKRRQVVGHSYGPSRKSQFIFFGVVAALVVLVIGGSAALVAAFDQPPEEYPDEAPWSEAGGAQNAAPRDPSGPCGEPGNPSQVAADSSCADRVTSEQDEPVAGVPQQGDEEGSGGVTDSGGDAGAAEGSTGDQSGGAS
jgi:hypothetical protein